MLFRGRFASVDGGHGGVATIHRNLRSRRPGAEWHSIPFDFDFKETSIPSAYTRSKHYYRRVRNVVDWSPLPDGKPVTVQLSNEGLKVTCKVTTCLSFEITGGRRVSSQSYGSGHTFEPPLWHQTTIEFPGAN